MEGEWQVLVSPKNGAAWTVHTLRLIAVQVGYWRWVRILIVATLHSVSCRFKFFRFLVYISFGYKDSRFWQNRLSRTPYCLTSYT